MRFSKLIPLRAALFVAAICCLSLADAPQSEALAGKWNMVSMTQDGNDVPWTLSITYKDGNYGATIGADEGESVPKSLKVEGSKVHMRVPYHGDEYDIDLKLSDGKLAGTWSGNGDSGQTKGERAAH